MNINNKFINKVILKKIQYNLLLLNSIIRIVFASGRFQIRRLYQVKIVFNIVDNAFVEYASMSA